jgi:hypothetical protein
MGGGIQMNENSNDQRALFLIEEYKNIAATHDNLRDLLGKIFTNFLLLSAFPFTVAGIVFRNGGFDLFSAPSGIHAVFIFAGCGNMLFALALLEARLGQYRYAHTVNLIRKYFTDNSPGLSDYLVLPTSASIPAWSSLGFVGYQLFFMILVAAAFFGYGIQGFMHSSCAITVLVLFIFLYVALHFYTLSKFKRHGGMK